MNAVAKRTDIVVANPPYSNYRKFATDHKDRLSQVWGERWVRHSLADEAIDMLWGLVEKPRTHRPLSRLLIGDTNCGKTAIALEFKDLVESETENEEDRTLNPIVLVQVPPEGSLIGLYDAILRAINAPISKNSVAWRKRDQIVDLLPKTGVRMVIFDEVQHALHGGSKEQSKVLAGIKHLSSTLEIPVVAIGTRDARYAVQTEPQIGNRLEIFEIKAFEPDENYAKFLHQLCKGMKLQKESNFKNIKLVTQFHALTGGLSGETRKLMARAAENAIMTGKERIDLESLKEVEWTVPGRRRSG